MKHYVDTSALLREVFGEPGAITLVNVTGATSALTRLECLRTIDRRRVRGLLTPEQAMLAQERALGLLAATDQVHLSPVVLQRAAMPLPAPLGSLDAIHLATALLWREHQGEEVTLVTHDVELALCARLCGLQVLGV